MTDITVWNYYNGDQLESFNRLVSTFNETIGKAKGIRVTGSSQGTVNDLEANVMDAAEGKVGSAEMPTICRLRRYRVQAGSDGHGGGFKGLPDRG